MHPIAAFVAPETITSCFQVEDIEQALKDCAEAGMQLIDKVPCRGAQC
jgi:hypothetical protein